MEFKSAQNTIGSVVPEFNLGWYARQKYDGGAIFVEVFLEKS